MLFEIFIWIMAFLSTFISVFWIIVNLSHRSYKKPRVLLKEYKTVTVAVPVWNEEKSIVPTLKSILRQDYPKNKLEIIIVDDKSRDNTVKVASDFIKTLKGINIRLIRHKTNEGKAGAVNTALANCKGEFFWVYDADSFASKDLLKSMVLRFYEPGNSDVAAVVAITLIRNQNNLVEKIQRLEYVMAAFIRKLMGAVDTLHITNALSVFKTNILKRLGGFHVGNLTEDFEIAMRLRSKGYRIVMCEIGNFHTRVPNTIKSMWMQRVRWFRGFIYNNIRYRSMVLNKKLGLLGMFQIPLEIFVLLAVFFSIGLFGYHLVDSSVDVFFKLYILRAELFDFTLPTLKQFVLDLNWILLFPSLVVLGFGLYLYFSAHKYVQEKWKFYIPSFLYLFVYPLFRSVQWLHAFILELGRAERKW